MQNERMKEIKNVVNEIICAYVNRPWHIYPKYTSKNETNVLYCNGEKAVKLFCHIWQDNYFNKPVLRARLELHTYTVEGEGYSIGTGSQHYLPGEKELEEGCWEEPSEFLFIKKVARHFYEISCYYKKRKELEKESRDISPGSPIDMLDGEFYSRDWTI